MSDEAKKTKYTVKIMVITHKQYRMPADPMYLPMHAGAAIARDKDWKEPDLGYVKDNTGENISARNATFCELTGLFWGWKHLHEDYIGLVHYRRHFRGRVRTRSKIRHDIFEHVLHHEELMPMLGRYKVFVPRKRYYVIESLYSHYKHTHYIEHLDKTREIIRNLYPDYLETYDDVMHRTSAHMFNMMIMERHLLDEYCTWLFRILFALEKEVDVSTYTDFQSRYAGRVGELIFNVWLEQQVRIGRLRRDEIRTLPYIFIERVNWWHKADKFLRAKFLHERYQ